MKEHLWDTDRDSVLWMSLMKDPLLPLGGTPETHLVPVLPRCRRTVLPGPTLQDLALFPVPSGRWRLHESPALFTYHDRSGTDYDRTTADDARDLVCPHVTRVAGLEPVTEWSTLASGHRCPV